MISAAVLIVGSLVALAWTALATRILRLSRGKWSRFLGPVGAIDPDAPAVDAIVPARNEEDHVAATVEALRGQEYPRLSITVVDDQSTDATAAILAGVAARADDRAPLRLVAGVERPEGWVGKTWAVHQGVATTSAGWLWFVDADMGLHPRALASAIAEAEREGADLVSLMPLVTCETFWQGAIASTLVQILGQLWPLELVNDPSRPEAIAAGGFLLVRRSAYERAGGHEACRWSIVEDLQLARHLKASGGRLLIRLGPGLARTHFYGRFGDIWRGLRKNAYAGMDFLPHKYFFGSIAGLAMAWAPLLTLGHGIYWREWAALVVGAWGVLAQALAVAPAVVFLRLRWPMAFALPAGISAYIAIATSSVWHHHRGRILWKGRAIPSATAAGPGGPTGAPRR